MRDTTVLTGAPPKVQSNPTTMPADPLDLLHFQEELHRQLFPVVPKKRHLNEEPWQVLLSAILTSDEAIPVPVDYALEKIFLDFSIDTFCKKFNLSYELKRYRIGDSFNLRAFYEFTFNNEPQD